MNIVILAAGQGQRMRSALPKVLHPLAGRPLLAHVMETARVLAPTRLVVVIGQHGASVREAVDAPGVDFVVQAPPLGTGHAVMQALDHLDDGVPTLVLYGDVPLIRAGTLRALVEAAAPDCLGVLTAHLNDPAGYGRIVRDAAGRILRIVEQRDASAREQAIHEINTGILVCPTARLKAWLATLSRHNAQGEYYLTDVVARAASEGWPIASAHPLAEWETLGVNSRAQLAELERIHQRNLAQQLLEDGVTLIDPARLDVRGTLSCGRDVVIDINCLFEGEVTLGDGVRVGANAVIRDAVICAGAEILPFCHVEQATVGERSRIGPYARLRPGTALGEGVHIGNFVEVKNSQVAAHSKANHLAYLGDATVGARVNIGAGVITCNYDGANKLRTVIEDDAFIGSDTQLVAPVRVGRGATLGAGTTLTRDAPEEQLTVSRARQTTLNGWRRPVRRKQDA